MKFTTRLVLVGALSTARALETASQWPVSALKQPLKPSQPSRPLEWGDINIISTTDTHGWLLGHEHGSFPEPNYSGTWGDYSAFVTHMKELAVEKDVDLLLVDSGDLHDGTGLVDGFPAGGVDAQDANEFFKQMPYDVLAIGNHELYVYANVYDMHMNFGQHYKDRYLSSNVNITVYDANNRSVSVPVGNRFRKFKTRKGRSVTAFGVIFNFGTNAVNTTVQRVEDMVKEQWFADAIVEEPDLFLLVGHMPVARDRWPLVFNAIRAVHPTTPILIFGGHLHVRDCLQLDQRSVSLASGRYMETLGWLSVDLDSQGNTQPLNFSRRYLDANVVTYQYHTNRTDFTFGTDQGRNITAGLRELEKRFQLTEQYGVAPRDYSMTGAPYPSNDSILTLTVEEAVPTVLALNSSRAAQGIPSLLIISSGSQRFDIFKGPFTRNDELTVSPFVNQYIFFPDVPFEVAVKVLPALNGKGAERLWPSEREEGESREMRAWRVEREVEREYANWLEDMHRQYYDSERSATLQGELTLGYVTTDACPGVGDDVAHLPIPAYRIPDFIASRTPEPVDGKVDLIFVDFIEGQLTRTLNELQTERVYTRADASVYAPVWSNQVLGRYARVAWN
ncbi:Metallo-dependent phosphatase-like protein [Mycena metata]|uniref:Metallo-dependent phosphatase-like protein n=1 Tax=Mycena metata TaxID=1033252 RepID=A0AAD7J521_9AGAR|nr:Metallo-dependent phosphatase-like protein [Mycena metata]